MTEIGTQSKVGLIKFQQNIYILKQTLQDKGLFVYFGSYFVQIIVAKFSSGSEILERNMIYFAMCNFVN